MFSLFGSVAGGPFLIGCELIKIDASDGFRKCFDAPESHFKMVDDVDKLLLAEATDSKLLFA